MVEVNNPYVDEIRKLMIEIGINPNDEQKKQLFVLQEKSRAWTQAKLEELSGGKQIVDSRLAEVKPAFGESKFPTLNKQYKEACNIYKSLMALVDESRKLKKSLRDEIATKREKEKNEDTR